MVVGVKELVTILRNQPEIQGSSGATAPTSRSSDGRRYLAPESRRRSRAAGLGPRTSRGLGLVPGLDNRSHVRGESGRRYLAPESREDGGIGWLRPTAPGKLGEPLASPAPRVPRLGLGLRAILPAEVAVPRAALVQRFGQGQEGRVQLVQAVVTRAGVAGRVAVGWLKPTASPSRMVGCTHSPTPRTHKVGWVQLPL